MYLSEREDDFEAVIADAIGHERAKNGGWVCATKSIREPAVANGDGRGGIWTGRVRLLFRRRKR